MLDLERLKTLCAETPKGPWGYYGDTVVGLIADCDCPEVPLLNEHAGIGYYCQGPPHECHDITPGLFEDDVASGTLSFEQYIAVLKFCAEARAALPALVDELEKVYAVMEKYSPPLIVVEPNLLLKKFGSTWGVFHNGKAVGGFPTFREALHRAWELEKAHAKTQP